jgi:hypothetical protein
MTRLIGAAVAMALVLGLTGPTRADDKDANAILDKAIKAMGGEEKLKKALTFTQSAKGTIAIMGMDSEITTRMSVQDIDHTRQEFEGNFGGNAVKGITVLAGDKAWRKFGDDKTALEGDQLAAQKRGVYMALVPTTILPLKEKGFKVEAAGEEKVGDKPAVKVKGTGPDGKEFTLYFDKESGLPVKMAGKVMGFMGEEVVQETTYSDYKDMDGVKKATKVKATRDGTKFLETEVTEFKAVDKFDPKTFTEPE